MPPRVLVVEDDDAIRMTLRLALQDEGYLVLDEPSAEGALARARSTPVDVMVVDLMLDGMDGYEFIRRVRPVSGAPVIVVSARADSHDIVAALEAGADDYVTKPFEIKELTARLRALRRRSRVLDRSGTAPVVLEDGQHPLVLDAEAAVVTRGGEPVHLTVTEYRLLAELAGTPGRVLSREQLLDRVWDRGFFGDERIVDVHVRRLRTKIERDPARPQVIRTVRGLGYRLERL